MWVRLLGAVAAAALPWALLLPQLAPDPHWLRFLPLAVIALLVVVVLVTGHGPSPGPWAGPRFGNGRTHAVAEGIGMGVVGLLGAVVILALWPTWAGGALASLLIIVAVTAGTTRIDRNS